MPSINDKEKPILLRNSNYTEEFISKVKYCAKQSIESHVKILNSLIVSINYMIMLVFLITPPPFIYLSKYKELLLVYLIYFFVYFTLNIIFIGYIKKNMNQFNITNHISLTMLPFIKRKPISVEINDDLVYNSLLYIKDEEKKNGVTYYTTTNKSGAILTMVTVRYWTQQLLRDTVTLY